MAIKFGNLRRPKGTANLMADQAQSMLQQATALHKTGQLARALMICQEILKLQPKHFSALYTTGILAFQMKDYAKAVHLFDQVIGIKPDFAEVYSNRGLALEKLGQFDAAVSSFDKAIAIKPGFAEACYNRGIALAGLENFEAAIASYDKAIIIQPDLADAYYNRGLALQVLKRLEGAVASYDKAIAIQPNHAEAFSSRGVALQDLQQLDDAIDSFDKAIAIRPGFSVAHENRLFCLSHSPHVDARKLRAEHLTFGQQFETPLRAGWQSHSNVKDPDRCLQVGLVSGDLRNHPVSQFLEPVLQFLAMKSSLSLHAYDTQSVDDDVSRRLRTCFTHWHAIGHLDDAELASKIRADGIDILIDLSGHSAQNRLLGFARKPAPIQASWLGYPGTTGLQAMDYLLGDRFYIPPELAWQFTEKLAYLPAAAIFQPHELSPLVNPLPALGNGYLSFGSFNRASKINSHSVALWSSLLRSVPTAHMTIGAVALENQNKLIQGFLNEGIAPDRLTFFPRTSALEYLALHHQVDICLDTFPYGGGTTTACAGWMGVPTLTLAGETPPSRAGACFMNHWGLTKFVAASPEDFVNKGLYWSNHIADLADIRLEMRARFNESALGRPQAFADALELTLRAMWRRWCEGLPPDMIDLAQGEITSRSRQLM